MDWDEEVARARRLKEEAIEVERDRAQAAAVAAAQADADRQALCEALESVRDALIRAKWPAASQYRPRFASLSKLSRTLRGQTYVEMRVPDIVQTAPGIARRDIEIVYCKYPDIDDGHLISVTSEWSAPSRVKHRIRDIKLIGAKYHLLTPELVVLAAARYCGENDGVVLDVIR